MKKIFFIFLFLIFLGAGFYFFNFYRNFNSSGNSQGEINFLFQKSPSFFEAYQKSLPLFSRLPSYYQEIFKIYSSFLVKNQTSPFLLFALYLKNPLIYQKIESFSALFKDLSLNQFFPKELEEKKAILSFLGQDQEKNYLIIFQDPLIERPSGGIFAAYAILNFQRENYNISKASHIIDLDLIFQKEYLPYPILSKQTDRLLFHDLGWFLNAESNSQEVLNAFNSLELNDLGFDGVIFINLGIFQEILKVAGPIEINNQMITQENVLNYLRNLISSDFRSNTNQKFSPFFFSFLKVIFEKIQNLEEEKFLYLAEIFKEALERKDIQLSLQDQEIMRFLKENGIIPSFQNENLDYLSVVFFSKNEDFSKEKSLPIKFSLDSLIFENETKNNLIIFPQEEGYLKIYLPSNAKIEKVKNCFLNLYLKENLSGSFWPESYDKRVFDMEKQIEVYEENGKKVIGCYNSKNLNVEITYFLDFGKKELKEKGKWQLIIEKQSGKDTYFSYNILNFKDLNLQPTLFAFSQWISLEKDLEINFYLNQE
ncbi:MAG: DUF4012 domain-containing protein [Minisyncoccia bacterium]